VVVTSAGGSGTYLRSGCVGIGPAVSTLVPAADAKVSPRSREGANPPQLVIEVAE